MNDAPLPPQTAVSQTATPRATKDGRTWYLLLDRYGSWDSVIDELYRAIGVNPYYQRTPLQGMAFRWFQTLVTTVLKRVEVSDPANCEEADAVNEAFTALLIETRAGAGLTLSTVRARTDTIISPMGMLMYHDLEAQAGARFQEGGRGGQTMRGQQPRVDHDALEQSVEQYMQAIWSTTTWSQMRSLWSFAEVNDMPVDDHTAVIFVHVMEVSVQAKHTYARHLINVFRKLGCDTKSSRCWTRRCGQAELPCRCAMRHEMQARMQYIWGLIERCPTVFADPGPTPTVDADDGAPLVQAGVVEKSSVSQPTFGSAFTVVEEKKGQLRRRFILWPRQVSLWLADQGYLAHMNLNTQPWAYVHEGGGGIRDLNVFLSDAASSAPAAAV